MDALKYLDLQEEQEQIKAIFQQNDQINKEVSMAITVKGTRVKNMELKRGEEGELRIEGNYDIITSADTVLASMGYNTYNGKKVTFSPVVVQAAAGLMELVQKDLDTMMGVN